MDGTTSSNFNDRKTHPSATSQTLSSKASPKPRFPFKDTRRRTSPITTIERSSVTGARIEKKPTEGPKSTPTAQQKRTRLEITCAPSDSTGDVKNIVAFWSGIKPEAILLKKQGMRPFKDPLTLEDYEVGNGSSLDLEIDTTD